MKYQTKTLASGLRIILAAEDSPVSYLGIGIAVGSRHESRLQHGLAHGIEHMLFKGTRLRSATQIIQRMEAVGAELNAYTTKEETMLYALFPSAYRQRSLQVLLDIARHSRFPEEEWAKEREVIIDELHSYEDSPSELIFDEFEDQVFRGHPLGHAILGTERSVGRLTTEQQRSFFARYYRPERMVLFAQGAFTMEELTAFAEAAYPGEALPYRKGPEQAQPLPELSARTVIRHKQTSQSHVLIGRSAYSLYHPHRLELSLLANILGGNGMNARLNMELRERRGLVYHVECNYTPYSDTGLFAVYFGSSHRAEAEAIELVLAELERMRQQPLSEQELAAALRQLRGQLLISAESREQSFLAMGKSFLHLHRYVEDTELQERLGQITTEGLYEVAVELFDTSQFHRLIYR